MVYTQGAFEGDCVMGVSVERLYALWGLLALVPMIVLGEVRYRVIVKSCAAFSSFQKEGFYAMRRFMLCIRLRSFCFAFAWCMLVFAYAGISWGTVAVPVQKSGNTVAMVFDISYSMTAPDGPGGVTRLEAASRYARMLLPSLRGNFMCAVIAKGEGVTAVPVTDDSMAVRQVLEHLSPVMMSAPGSSVGKGIKAALRAFPRQMSRYGTVWVFTDGEESDGALQGALADAQSYGVPVVIIGFGSERESEILAGDGKTRVKTALRADRIKKTIAAVKKSRRYGTLPGNAQERDGLLQYVNAADTGSALAVLKSLRNADSGMVQSSFENERIRRHGLFTGLAVAALCLGVVLSEFDLRNVRRKLRAGMAGTGALIVLLCTSCSVRAGDSRRVLESAWAWRQGNYHRATAGFLRTEEHAAGRNDRDMMQYAQYGLAVTYLMQGEEDAAFQRLQNIAPDAPERVLFAALYNSGIIAYHRGNYGDAASFFRQALSLDNTSSDAKLNLELSLEQRALSQAAAQKSNAPQPLQGNNEKASPESSAIFARIREDEQKRWKNQQQALPPSSEADY